MFKPTCEALRRKPHHESSIVVAAFHLSTCCLEYKQMITGTHAIFFPFVPSPFFISLVLDLTASSSCLTYFHSSTPPPFPPCPLPLPSLSLSFSLSQPPQISTSSFLPPHPRCTRCHCSDNYLLRYLCHHHACLLLPSVPS